MIAAIAPPLIAMSTRRALPGNRALVIIVIIACTCHPASDQKVMGACGRNIVHIRSRLGCLASYTNPLHRTPLIVWRHLRRHVQIVFPVYMQVFCEQNPPVCTVVRKEGGRRFPHARSPPSRGELSTALRTFIHICPHFLRRGRRGTARFPTLGSTAIFESQRSGRPWADQSHWCN